jgi:hypothetical protein
VNRLQQSYYELIFAQESQRVRFDLLDARKRTLAGLERQVEQGLLTPTDTLVARAQLAALETILLTATNAVLLTQNALRTLLGEDWRNQPDSLFEPVERLWIHVEEFDLHASWNRGLALRSGSAKTSRYPRLILSQVTVAAVPARINCLLHSQPGPLRARRSISLPPARHPAI